MSRFVILVAPCILALGSLTTCSADGPGQLPPLTCTPLPASHPCRRVSPSSYTFTQFVPGFPIIIEGPDIDVALLLFDNLSPPEQCSDSLLYLACLLFALPCDPDSGLPYPVCERSCRAFQLQRTKGTCEQLNEELRAIGESPAFDLEGFTTIANINDNFDCSNTSTFVFLETNFSRDDCTDILSAHVVAEIETSIGCVPQPTGQCALAGHSPQSHYIVALKDREQDAVFEITPETDIAEDPVCSNLLLALACRYTYPPCNPSSMTQFGLCPDACSMAEDALITRCADFLAPVLDSNSSFAEFVANFSCSNGSYLVEGVPVDGECDALEGVFERSVSIGAIVGGCLAAVAVVLLVVMAVVLCACCVGSRKQKRVRLPSYSLSLVPRSGSNNLYRNARQGSLLEQPCPGEDMAVSLTLADKKLYEVMFASVLIPYSRLIFGETLGEGAFGKVIQGQLLSSCDETTEVAIKTVKHLSSQEQLKEFFSESLIMKDFEHPNVLGLVGVCFDSPDGFPCIILPYMAQGNLRSYLKSRRVHVTDVHTLPEQLSVELLIHVCIDVACGMRYLAKRLFVHRDLAARNCMVDHDLAIRVGDFGLTRDIYTTNYYRADRSARLPVKWMPPETLHDGISNEHTDMWSFGVTCWEVFSLGRSPYPGVDNAEIVKHITSGGRLERPQLCPLRMFDILCKCWELKPEDRPTFSEMVDMLQEYWDDRHFYIVRSLSTV